MAVLSIALDMPPRVEHVPSTIGIGYGGQDTSLFTIQTSTVTSPQTVTISATPNGASKATTLTITS